MNPDQPPVVDARALAGQVMQEEQERQAANAAETANSATSNLAGFMISPVYLG